MVPAKWLSVIGIAVASLEDDKWTAEPDPKPTDPGLDGDLRVDSGRNTLHSVTFALGLSALAFLVMLVSASLFICKHQRSWREEWASRQRCAPHRLAVEDADDEAMMQVAEADTEAAFGDDADLKAIMARLCTHAHQPQTYETQAEPPADAPLADAPLSFGTGTSRNRQKDVAIPTLMSDKVLAPKPRVEELIASETAMTSTVSHPSNELDATAMSPAPSALPFLLQPPVDENLEHSKHDSKRPSLLLQPDARHGLMMD